MAAEVKGAGDTDMRENPHVTSKFDRMHGHPRTPSKVERPGDPAEPMFAHERVAPSKVEHKEHGTVHHYEPGHPALGGLEHGTRAKHPTHDEEQAAYEREHGYHSGRSGDGK